MIAKNFGYLKNSYFFPQHICKKWMKLEFQNVESAYTDLKKIVLPMWCIADNILEILKIEGHSAFEVSRALVNGFQIHEALHIKWTPDYFENANKWSIDNNFPAFPTLVNVVEDIWIEEKSRTVFSPTINNWLVLINQFLFSEIRFQELTESPDFNDLKTILILMTNLKRSAFRDDPIYQDGILSEIFPILAPLWENPASCDMFSKRWNIAVQIAELLKQSDTDCEGENEDINPEPNLNNILDDEMTLEKLLGSITEEEAGQIVEMMKTIQQELEREDEERKDHEKILKKVARWKTDSSFEFKVPDGQGEDLYPDPRFQVFGKVMLSFLEPKSYKGAPLIHGKIDRRHLHRIATDGKVMSKKSSEQKTKTPPEVSILVDFSGSMETNYGKAITLKHQVISAAYDAFMALITAKIPVSVYGHTTRGDKPVIYGLGAYQTRFLGSNELTNVIDKGIFESAVNTNSGANFDGAALAWVVSQFSHNNKLVIVFSDGLPSGSPAGIDAETHLVHEINEARKNKIVIACCSLTDEVKGQNDKLYGSENNILASANIGESIRNILNKHIKGE